MDLGAVGKADAKALCRAQQPNALASRRRRGLDKAERGSAGAHVGASPHIRAALSNPITLHSQKNACPRVSPLAVTPPYPAPDRKP